MKVLNTMMFVSNACEELVGLRGGIENEGTFEAAKEGFYKMMGYIRGLNTFNNTMVCLENNDFTEAFSDVLYGWERKACQALINKASETGQSEDVIHKLLEMRDGIPA